MKRISSYLQGVQVTTLYCFFFWRLLKKVLTICFPIFSINLSRFFPDFHPIFPDFLHQNIMSEDFVHLYAFTFIGAKIFAGSHFFLLEHQNFGWGWIYFQCLSASDVLCDDLNMVSHKKWILWIWPNYHTF